MYLKKKKREKENSVGVLYRKREKKIVLYLTPRQTWPNPESVGTENEMNRNEMTPIINRPKILGIKKGTKEKKMKEK